MSRARKIAPFLIFILLLELISLLTGCVKKPGSGMELYRTKPSVRETPAEQPGEISRFEEKLNINRMDEVDFIRAGLNQKSARAILSYRARHGDFHSVEELRAVPQLDPTWLSQSRDRLTVLEP